MFFSLKTIYTQKKQQDPQKRPVIYTDKKNIVILLYQNNMQTKEVLKPLPGIIHLVYTQNFPKKLTFLTP